MKRKILPKVGHEGEEVILIIPFVGVRVLRIESIFNLITPSPRASFLIIRVLISLCFANGCHGGGKSNGVRYGSWIISRCWWWIWSCSLNSRLTFLSGVKIPTFMECAPMMCYTIHLLGRSTCSPLWNFYGTASDLLPLLEFEFLWDLTFFNTDWDSSMLSSFLVFNAAERATIWRCFSDCRPHVFWIILVL